MGIEKLQKAYRKGELNKYFFSCLLKVKGLFNGSEKKYCQYIIMLMIY